MQLISLEVRKATTGEPIREILFNDSGLSLIVDETNSLKSGSNIGKTTAAKIIDLCLGAKSVSSLYKEKDTGENQIVGEFLAKNKVIAELKCKIDNKEYVFKRALYPNGNSEINGEAVKTIVEYNSKLNEIIFANAKNKPTFRQLISKFIRLESMNEDSLLKYLGSFCKTYQYQAIYDYLFGVDTSKSENVDLISLNQSIDKDIDAIYRKNGVSSIKEFETKIALMKEEVDKFKKSYSEATVIEEYQEKVREIQSLLVETNKVESEHSKLSLKIELIKEKIDKEKEKIFNLDNKVLKKLYEETKILLDIQLKDFSDLVEFHNGMVNKRISMLIDSMKEMLVELQKVEETLTDLRKEYEVNYVSFNVELKDKFEEKYAEFAVNKIKLENYTNDYEYILDKHEEKRTNESRKVEESKDDFKKKAIEDKVNKYFKDLTKNIIGESFAIVFSDTEDEFPVKIIGLNGKPGTGIKKAMITCFDLAHVCLILENSYHMPTFVIHDKLENIDLVELRGIITEARKFKGQYVFPILNDRISMLEIKEEEVVLRLSASDKFFHI